MKLVWATVLEASAEDSGVQRLEVDLDSGAPGSALAYTQLTGICAASDRVLLNTTAVELELGTGGDHFVVCRLGDAQGVALDRPSGGHIMKLRYTPLQVDVVSVEAPESPHHEVMRTAESLEGTPVVCCGLHSQVPLVAAAVRRGDPSARVVYCATDQAALPLALSRVVKASYEAGLIDATVTCGQAFGGMLEAVNLHSGLLAARHVLKADVIIVAIGPGVAGTSTPFGHGGVGQGEAVNAVAALGGQPVVCLRMSFADARERHRGVSHHSLVALSRIALAPAIIAVPSVDSDSSDAIRGQLAEAGVTERHRLVESPEGAIAAPPLCGVNVTTMGRRPHDDPAFFSAAYAAGEIASRLSRGVLE